MYEKMKKLSYIVIVSILLFIATTTTILKIASWSHLIYQWLFENTWTYTRISKDSAEKNALMVISFLRNWTTLNNSFLTENEISHMEDVKQLIDICRIIAIFSIILLGILNIKIRKEMDFKKIYLKSLLISASVPIIIWVTSIITSFRDAFILMHKMFFRWNYLFDENSGLIILFNERFFEDFWMIIWLWHIIFCLVIFALIKVFQLKSETKNE